MTATTAKNRQMGKLRKALRYADLLVFVRPLLVLCFTGWLAYELAGHAESFSHMVYALFIPFVVAFIWLFGYFFTAVRRKSTLRAFIIVRNWFK